MTIREIEAQYNEIFRDDFGYKQHHIINTLEAIILYLKAEQEDNLGNSEE